MNDIQFEWDEIKSRENKRKHKVSFEEAQTVFLDENAIRYFGPDHSQDEDRFIIGMPYQSLINLYLRDCALHHKKLQIKWAS